VSFLPSSGSAPRTHSPQPYPLEFILVAAHTTLYFFFCMLIILVGFRGLTGYLGFVWYGLGCHFCRVLGGVDLSLFFSFPGFFVGYFLSHWTQKLGSIHLIPILPFFLGLFRVFPLHCGLFVSCPHFGIDVARFELDPGFYEWQMMCFLVAIGGDFVHFGLYVVPLICSDPLPPVGWVGDFKVPFIGTVVPFPYPITTISPGVLFFPVSITQRFVFLFQVVPLSPRARQCVSSGL